MRMVQLDRERERGGGGEREGVAAVTPDRPLTLHHTVPHYAVITTIQFKGPYVREAVAIPYATNPSVLWDEDTGQ